MSRKLCPPVLRCLPDLTCLRLYHCVLLTVFYLQSHIIGAQKRDVMFNATASIPHLVDSSYTSVGKVLATLKTIPELKLSFSESNFEMEKLISLPKGESLTVKSLLDIISVSTGTKYKFVGSHIVFTQNQQEIQKHTVSGYVTDGETGEALIGAIVMIKGTRKGTTTNVYGYYSMTIDAGSYTLGYSYLGYDQQEKNILLNDDQIIDVELGVQKSELQELVVSSDRLDANITRNIMGFNKLDAKTIESVPQLMGEVDLIRVIKLLPGVSMTTEASSGFSVRGGNLDQNLILLDEALVYNASHLIGLFSTFNNDAIKSLEFYKGFMPAKYGGRISSVLDIRMKDGNYKKLTAKGGVSLISSRLTLETPIAKDKASLMISGRRMYMDLLLRAMAKDAREADLNLYFYDLNTKINWRANESNSLFVSGFFGRDVFRADFGGTAPRFDWGNQTLTTRWNHVFDSRLFSNISLIYSSYDYNLSFGESGVKYDWKSNLSNWTAKLDFDYYLNTRNSIAFGFQSTYYRFDPGKISVELEDTTANYSLQRNQALEHAVFVSNEQKITDHLTLSYGLRGSAFQNIGKQTIYLFNDEYGLKDTTKYKKGNFYKTHYGLEPRIGITRTIDSRQSIKASYTLTRQYIQQATNSIGGRPFDVWFPASPNVKAQYGHQYSIGYFRNFKDNTIEASAEMFFKDMRNQIDFKDHANLVLEEKLEGELRRGSGEAYGMEFMLKKPSGRINGWVSYTLSRSVRYFDEINEGKKYLSPFDRTHNFSLVFSYELSRKVNVSGTWVYVTGLPLTTPFGRAQIGNVVIPAYTGRNADRMPSYHRGDIGIEFPDRRNRRYKSNWVVSVYNVYNNFNPMAISFERSEDDNSRSIVKGYSIFPIMPSVAWNFEF